MQTPEKANVHVSISKNRWLLDESNAHGIKNLFLEKYIQKIKNRKRSQIRIWSTNCHWGKSAYSLSILIEDYLTKNNITSIKLNTFEILATDSYPCDIFMAIAGRYHEKEMQEGITPYYKENFFTFTRDAYALNDSTKKIVTVKDFDPRKDFSAFGKFDLILCPSLSIFFDDNMKRDVCQRFSNSLETEGVLLLNPLEQLPDDIPALTLCQEDSTRYYEKKPRN